MQLQIIISMFSFVIYDYSVNTLVMMRQAFAMSLLLIYFFIQAWSLRLIFTKDLSNNHHKCKKK